MEYVVEEVEKEASERKKIKREITQDYLKGLQRTLELVWSKKPKLFDDDEEDDEESYNVSVYRILPYPPNTKNPKDFFIQRTEERVFS